MNAALALATTAWLAAAMAGMTVLWGYALEPSASATAPARWPQGATVPFDPERPTLVVLAHPRCPCTRATLGELDRLVAQVSGEITVHVFFYRPGTADVPADLAWERGPLWGRAAEIPGLTLHEDPAGSEAERFGAVVSGQVLLYDPHGELLFSGGLTAGRGHAGDNEGRSAVVDHVLGRGGAASKAPVYGCSIRGEAGPEATVR